ncbi:MAG: glycosyltransferase [Candidatus Omnitrophica bacterium]|nr:glycosyltransferase [Candidatus Omnitrophota bacterium]MCM8826269.1 glycosyltransferase [Candidatus Omnitrophota bacterium]
MNIMQMVPKMDIGGVERGVLDIAKYFKDRPHKIIVVSGGGRLVKKLEEYKVKHYKLGVYKKSPLSLLLIRKIRRIIEDENIDIVHARSRVPGWIGFFATRNRETDFITTAHGAYSKHIFSEVMAWGKFVICPSQIIARYMQDSFGVPKEKIVLINRWVDLDNFKFSEDKYRDSSATIVSIGRISPIKGYQYLIEAMRKVVRVNPYAILNIVGSAEKSKLDYFNYLKNLVNQYALSYNVYFLGYHQDIESILKKAKIIVVPSIGEESFGRVIIEAFACGVPVIATKVGAFPEIIDNGKDGILVSPRDSEAISEAIINLLNNPSLAKKLALEAYKKVKRDYGLQKCVGETEKLYEYLKKFKRILVIKVSSLGDVILAIPSLKVIKEKFPISTVTLITHKKYASLFSSCPFVDKVIPVDSSYRRIKKVFKIANHLRRLSFDYIIDLQNNLASHLIAFLSFPKYSFGYRRKLGFLLSSSVKYVKEKLDPLTSQEKILSLLDIRFKDKRLTFWEVKDVILDNFGLYKKDSLIGINVSASSKWASKNWPVTHIEKLIELISKNYPHFKILLIGDEHSYELIKDAKVLFPANVINLCGKTTINDLVGVISVLKLFISPDTANLHLALALGIPTIALFGPTDPQRHTINDSNLYIFFKKLPCSFCYRPKCKSNLCMENIKPQEVFLKVKEILG